MKIEFLDRREGPDYGIGEHNVVYRILLNAAFPSTVRVKICPVEATGSVAKPQLCDCIRRSSLERCLRRYGDTARESVGCYALPPSAKAISLKIFEMLIVFRDNDKFDIPVEDNVSICRSEYAATIGFKACCAFISLFADRIISGAYTFVMEPSSCRLLSIIVPAWWSWLGSGLKPVAWSKPRDQELIACRPPASIEGWSRVQVGSRFEKTCPIPLHELDTGATGRRRAAFSRC